LYRYPKQLIFKQRENESGEEKGAEAREGQNY
jgi:hypothetical protein